MRRRNLAIGLAIGTGTLVAGLLIIYWPLYTVAGLSCGRIEGALPLPCQPLQYFVRLLFAALPFVGMGVTSVSLAGLALSVSRANIVQGVKPARSRILPVFGGLLASCSIFLAMFVVIQGLLFGEVQTYYSPSLWVGIVYATYLVIGSASLARHRRAFGLTLILMGLLAALVFFPVVNFGSPTPPWYLSAIGLVAWVALATAIVLASRWR